MDPNTPSPSWVSVSSPSSRSRSRTCPRSTRYAVAAAAVLEPVAHRYCSPSSRRRPLCHPYLHRSLPRSASRPRPPTSRLHRLRWRTGPATRTRLLCTGPSARSIPRQHAISASRICRSGHARRRARTTARRTSSSSATSSSRSCSRSSTGPLPRRSMSQSVCSTLRSLAGLSSDAGLQIGRSSRSRRTPRSSRSRWICRR